MDSITIPNAILLGLVQGFSEWLPISSSGHLVIVQTLLGITVPAAFDIVIMFGTIAALLLYFRQRIIALLTGVLARDPVSLRYCFFVVIAGIGTAAIGFAGRSFFTGLFAEPFIVSCLLVVTGIFLFIASRVTVPEGELTAGKALVIGIAQGVAVAPGISRSGSTIGAAILLGITAEEAAVFSFLIGIPAMTLASLITFLDEPAMSVAIVPLAIATITAFIAGYASIEVLMRILKEKRFIFFAYYCIAVGIVFAALTYHP